MKKMITCLAILTMLSTMVSCGIDDVGETSGSTPDIITSTSSTETAGTKSSEPETEAAETAHAAAEEKTEAKSPAKAENDEATAAAPAADNAQPKSTEPTEAPANEAPKEPLVLNENERLFGGYVDTKGDNLNMREEPFISAEIIGSIPDGTQINVFSCGKAGWYATSFNGKTGYISADFVNEIPSDNTGYFLTDISELVGQWKYQVAPEGMNITAGVTDNGIIDIKGDSTYVYTDLEGKTHSGTVRVDYDTFDGDYRIPFFAFYEGDEFFIVCYCQNEHSDVYVTGNGGESQIVRN